MPRRVANPPNPWSSQQVEWLEERPPVELEVYEEEAKSIVAENDSPDIGFRFGVNPYRGCFHGCSYCLSGDTTVLMADGSLRAMSAISAGDAVIGTRPDGRYRRYVRTQVLDHWRTMRRAHRITLEDGTAIVASEDHRFLTERGWKYVRPLERDDGQRPHLTSNNRLRGFGAFASPPLDEGEYRRGYICGMVR